MALGKGDAVVALEPDTFPLGRREAPSVDALLGPASASWRIRQSGGIVMSMAKARAALLQIAHPKIAAGLVEHSSFDADPYKRIRITGQTMSAIHFGSAAERKEALRLLGRLHARVRGTLPNGDAYRASDPELMWFVLATLIDSDLLVEDLYVRDFNERDRDAYFAESVSVAEAFGIPSALVASDRSDLRDYIASANDVFAVSAEARQLAARIFEPTFLRVPRVVIWGYKQLMIDLLPPDLRRGYGVGTPRSFAARAVVSASRLVLPLLPPRLRRQPLTPRES